MRKLNKTELSACSSTHFDAAQMLQNSAQYNSTIDICVSFKQADKDYLLVFFLK